jgi:hypothetical protein
MGVGVKPFVGVTPADEEDNYPDADPTVTDHTKFVVEVIREIPLPKDVYRGQRTVETVRTDHIITNIGAGPVLPQHPYENQVWILI